MFLAYRKFCAYGKSKIVHSNVNVFSMLISTDGITTTTGKFVKWGNVKNFFSETTNLIEPAMHINDYWIINL